MGTQISLFITQLKNKKAHGKKVYEGEGYILIKVEEPNKPEPFKENCRTINVGFAPGEVAVVWVAGIVRQIEVGRYQGIKTEIPKEQVEKLKDEPEYSMLRPEYQESIMKNPGIIPQEVQEANKDKPIPYGLWDTYRKKYNWKVNYELPKEAELDEMTYDFYNGEETNLFGDYQIKRYQIPKELHWNYDEEKAIPKQISFRWKEKVKKNVEDISNLMKIKYLKHLKSLHKVRRKQYLYK